MALADAVAFEAPRRGLRAGAVVVDHGLQDGSAQVAERGAEALTAMGLDPVEVRRVEVAASGEGLEAAARSARYAALNAAADRLDARLVLLGHTLDDQAEQVLLGLARGSGARSLAGMPPARGRYRRPLLGVTRAQCRDALTAEGVRWWWDDPMNDDPAYTRVRARRALADLERDLGPGVTTALARTAAHLRDDADLLDALADDFFTIGEFLRAENLPIVKLSVPVADLVVLHRAVRTRVWRRLLVEAGAPPGQVSTRHTDACDRLLTDWRGQGPVHAPGGVRVERSAGSGATVSVTGRDH